MTSSSPFHANPAKDTLLRLAAVVSMVIIFLTLVSLLGCLAN